MSRATAVTRTADGVLVTLTDGPRSSGSHCLMAVGSVPNTADLGLDEAGVRINGDRLCRGRPGVAHLATGVYAAGDCTGVAHARVSRCDAGTDRDVARAR